MKKIFKYRSTQHILGFFAAIYIFFVKLTSRIYITNLQVPKLFWDDNKPFILAFWHSQLMTISFAWSKKTKINIIASQHSDGRFGSIVGSYFRLNNIPRSSKSPNTLLRTILKLVDNKEYIGITPDGPRGPNQKVSDGIIKLASSLQIPIIACGFWSSKNFKLKSWDKFLITLPFSNCHFIWSKPIYVEKKVKIENILKYQNLLEKELNNNIYIAQQKCGLNA